MIREDVQKLDPGARVVLYEIGETYRFHGENYGPITWRGNVYSPFPVTAEGFENGKGPLPTPKLHVANIGGVIGSVLAQNDDLVGMKVTRWVTLARYLDAPLGTTPDPNAHFPKEVWYINRRADENKVFITLELSAAWDVTGVQIPKRVCVRATCLWKYRGSECGYTGAPVAKADDSPTSDPAQDVCGKRVASCKLRFGANGVLPFGGFPSLGKVRT